MYAWMCQQRTQILRKVQGYIFHIMILDYQGKLLWLRMDYVWSGMVCYSICMCRKMKQIKDHGKRSSFGSRIMHTCLDPGSKSEHWGWILQSSQIVVSCLSTLCAYVGILSLAYKVININHSAPMICNSMSWRAWPLVPSIWPWVQLWLPADLWWEK